MGHRLSRRAIVVALAGLAGVVSLGRSAAAKDSDAGAARPAPSDAFVDLQVLVASKVDGGSVDERLAKTLPLHRAPFRSFNAFRVLQPTERIPLKKGDELSRRLGTSRVLKLTLLEVIQDGDEHRFRVRAEIPTSDAGAQSFKVEFTAGRNGTVWLAGPAFEGGTLFLGVTMRERRHRAHAEAPPSPSR